MKEEISAAMKALTDSIGSHMPPDAAMKYSQAVLNLAHAHATLERLLEEGKKLHNA